MDVTNSINLREIDNILHKYGRAIIYGPNWNMDQAIAYLKKWGYIARRGADPSYIEVVLEEPSAVLGDIRDRRERIATAALQGMLAGDVGIAPKEHSDLVALAAVCYADALIAELDKESHL